LFVNQTSSSLQNSNAYDASKSFPMLESKSINLVSSHKLFPKIVTLLALGSNLQKSYMPFDL